MAGWDPLNMTMATSRRATTSKQSWHFKHKNDQRCTETAQGTALEFLSFDWQPFPRVQPGRLKLNEHFSKMLPNSVKASEKDFPPAFFIFNYCSYFHKGVMATLIHGRIAMP
jgi:hypothetical protein